jgi:hypothetical protein
MSTEPSSIILRVLQWILFAAGTLSLAIGIWVVQVTSKQEAAKRSNNALAQSGTIEPVDAIVTGKKVDTRTRSSGMGRNRTETSTREYKVLLRVDDFKPISRTVNPKVYDVVQEGDVYDAYLIDGEYFVPRLDAQTYDYVKWLIFAIFSIPMVGAITLFIVRMTMAFRTRSGETQPKSTVR